MNLFLLDFHLIWNIDYGNNVHWRYASMLT